MIVFCVLAYLLGSIPFGLLIAKQVKGVDVREHGSGNIGATNVFRIVGKKWGIFVLFLDALKGFLACQMPVWILNSGELGFTYLIPLAVLAILGHVFPVWLKWKGGKGVATALGVFLAMAPLPTLLAFAVFSLVFALFRIISVSSLAATALFPFFLYFFYQDRDGFGLLLAVSLILVAFVFYTHRANINRLRKGEEKRLI